MKVWAGVIKAICLCGNGTFPFYKTVNYADIGWDHSADKWDVVRLHGKIL